MATLFNSDWSNSTGTGDSAVNDGTTFYQGGTSTPPYWYEVHATDGTSPGERNFVRVHRCETGNRDLYQNTASLGSPNSLYFRMWFRLSSEWPASAQEHMIRVRQYADNNGDEDMYFFQIRQGAYPPGTEYPRVSFICYGSPSGTWSAKGRRIDDGMWHRWEIAVTGNNGATATITCKLDGIDITGEMRSHISI